MADHLQTPAIFIRAERGVCPSWQGGRGAVIKLCKYSCALYIINEALIRFDADRTQCQRLHLPGSLLHLQRISHFREPSTADTDRLEVTDRHPKLIPGSPPATIRSHYDRPAPVVDTLTFFSSVYFY